MSILSLLISSCSHSISKYSNEYEFEFYSRINKLCENKDDLTLEMIDGQKYNVKELIISVDTTKFIDINSNTTIIKSTKEISSISFTQTGRGVFEGLLYGSLIGGAAGLLPNMVLPKGTGHPSGNPLIILYGAVAGAVIGSTYGYMNPSKTIIKIN